MNFLQTILDGLRQNPDKPILLEIHGPELRPTTCGQLLADTYHVRHVLRAAGLRAAGLRAAGLVPADRVALLAPNSTRWVACDLAIMAEGAIVVPLYSRQAPDELIAMMKDCSPRLLLCATPELREAITTRWPAAPQTLLFDEVFSSPPLNKGGLGGVAGQLQSPAATPPPTPPYQGGEESLAPVALHDHTPLAIIYTSGTSGEAKGVVLTAGNLTFMVEQTRRWGLTLVPDLPPTADHRVFHYLPFCFAGSWIMLLTCLHRTNPLLLSMYLTNLMDDVQLAAPHYFLNVPALLERVRNGVCAKLKEGGGLAAKLFFRAQRAWFQAGNCSLLDRLALWLARKLVFPKIRSRLGPNLRALICGSAPLSIETQHFFEMLGIPVVQVYGLTETTAICTMDEPGRVEPGRVGRAIPGIEMKLGEQAEIVVRGPNVLPGYWNRPLATSEIIKDGWLHTGDQGEIDATGNWKITGRMKNLIITTGGHNISPEPIEELLKESLPEAEHVMVVGNDRKHLAAILAGKVTRERAEIALQQVNRGLPHYKQVRRFICVEPFTTANGLLTVNRKLKRAAIEAHHRPELDRLYQE